MVQPEDSSPHAADDSPAGESISPTKFLVDDPDAYHRTHEIVDREKTEPRPMNMPASFAAPLAESALPHYDDPRIQTPPLSQEDSQRQYRGAIDVFRPPAPAAKIAEKETLRELLASEPSPVFVSGVEKQPLIEMRDPHEGVYYAPAPTPDNPEGIPARPRPIADGLGFDTDELWAELWRVNRPEAERILTYHREHYVGEEDAYDDEWKGPINPPPTRPAQFGDISLDGLRMLIGDEAYEEIHGNSPDALAPAKQLDSRIVEAMGHQTRGDSVARASQLAVELLRNSPAQKEYEAKLAEATREHDRAVACGVVWRDGRWKGFDYPPPEMIVSLKNAGEKLRDEWSRVEDMTPSSDVITRGSINVLREQSDRRRLFLAIMQSGVVWREPGWIGDYPSEDELDAYLSKSGGELPDHVRKAVDEFVKTGKPRPLRGCPVPRDEDDQETVDDLELPPASVDMIQGVGPTLLPWKALRGTVMGEGKPVDPPIDPNDHTPGSEFGALRQYPEHRMPVATAHPPSIAMHTKAAPRGPEVQPPDLRLDRNRSTGEPAYGGIEDGDGDHEGVTVCTGWAPVIAAFVAGVFLGVGGMFLWSLTPGPATVFSPDTLYKVKVWRPDGSVTEFETAQNPLKGSNSAGAMLEVPKEGQAEPIIIRASEFTIDPTTPPVEE